ncbi:PIN domain-containing protein [Aurantimonas sp. MSK8Z-1]|uniref:PIN domain-containing protein n=1 Tax=Mangrovibrevibacter kandeliae TaxID=2968473 RepID=UPI002118024A|nr:PIN domain-containing protein [Aurantimonas sp. MSK8Z-1]MCW4116203.1 PIN domain-containing protein [Aurantimonas sp. MSK8Z-1]
MARYLLDTNIISDVFRHAGGRVDLALRARKDEEIGASLIVKGEILFGLEKNRNVRGLDRLKVFLQAIEVWDLEAPTEAIYAQVRDERERSGVRMGANDLWVAAHAIALEATLVSDDRAFLDVPRLSVENWLRD